MNVFFLILTHDRSESLLALLRSIDSLERPPGARFRILVWDNASAAEHVAALRSSPFFDRPEVRLLRSEENTFLRGKRLLEDALFAAGGWSEEDFVAHLDDDVQLSPGWLLCALRSLAGEGWIASGSVEERRGQVVYSGQARLHLREEPVDGRTVRVWDHCEQPVPDLAGCSRVQFAGHRGLLVRSGAAARVRHDPELLIGGEDLDYSLALQQAGGAIGIAHAARIVHRGLGEGDAPGFRTREKVLSSWRHFYRKWGLLRRNACREAGLSEDEWLRHVTAS
ncbi:MAG TPA: glycosyltransferase [Thermoanaerobaculia bacterium]|nr:glycosyltransferase [Thermoanaerobaculia bacterium]